MTKGAYHVLLFGVVLMLLTGCAGSSVKLFATKLDVQMTVSSSANPDEQGRASPIVLRVYELSDDAAMQNPDFFNLFDKEATVLADALLSRDQFELTPGTRKTFNKRANDETRYLAVVAAFRRISEAKWYDVFKLRLNRTNRLSIEVGTNTVSIKKR